MRSGSERSIMTLLLASRRGLPLLTFLPRRCAIPAFPNSPALSAALPSRLFDNNRAKSRATERCGAVQLIAAPLSMTVARPGPSGEPAGGGRNCSNQRSERNAQHGPPSATHPATSSPGGSKLRQSPGTVAIGGGRVAAGPRMAVWGAGAGAGGRGLGQASSSQPTGRQGGRGSSRGLHDSGSPDYPRPPSLEEIPEDQLQWSYVRASGAGGQNVNKVSTKVDVRFVVAEAEWLPHDVRLRLARQEKGRINNRGELVITAQEFRTQKKNRSQALQKLRDMIHECWEPAKERKMRTGISRKGKEMRRQEKLHRSKVKAGRSKLSSQDFD